MSMAQKNKPWPNYFIVRPSGDVVPLIAIDELPPGTDLFDVPRSFNLKATTGMLNLGLKRSNGSYYQIIQKSPSKSPERRKPPSCDPSDSTTICRHWCKHGICKWGQQCRYRHIMPMTIPGLQEVRLQDWPSWYRTLNPGYFAEKGREKGLRKENISVRVGAVTDGGEVCEVGGSQSLHRPRELCEEGMLGRGIDQKMDVDKERQSPRSFGAIGGKASRVRSSVRGRQNGEQLGDQILSRLRGSEWEELKEKEKGKRREGKSRMSRVDMNLRRSGSNAAIEKAVISDATRWEADESGVDEKDAEIAKNLVGLPSKVLVDI